MAYYKRNLPHYQPEGSTFFVTTRLAGTIPRHIFESIKHKYELEIDKIGSLNFTKNRWSKYKDIQLNQFIDYEKYLDSCDLTRKWLADDRIAEIASNALHFRDGKEFELIAYTIMPNHIHAVLKPNVNRFAESINSSANKDKYVLTKILQNYKKFTARMSNKILNRTGQFWQHESYDHVIRDNEELNRTIKYVLHNPVKAGLVKYPEEWKWSYCKYEIDF